MIVLAVVLFCIVLVFCWVLFVPLIIEVDTSQSIYQVYQPFTFRFWLGHDFHPSLSILGISINTNQKKSNEIESGKAEKRKNTFPVQKTSALVKRLLASICIKRFNLDVDTDDVVMNAKMLPAFLLLSRGPVHFTTNFEGRVYLNLLAEVRLYRISGAFISFHFKS